jgi:peptidyl-prolyl cis-trans isomerase D
VLKLQKQTRSSQTLEIKASDFANDVSISDEELNEYYQANLSDFDTEEQVKLSYVSLSVEDLIANESVSDEEALQNYQENIAAYQTTEERRISHILIEFAEDEVAAEAKANEVLAMVNAPDADFAAIAGAESNDIISAEEGGDLDFITRGDWSIAFEDAAFGLESVGDTTGLVKTEFGFHIIKLTELKPQITTPFEDVKQEIIDFMLKDKATDTFFALQEQIASAAFESPDSLDEVSTIANRPVIDTAFFSKGNYPASVDYPQVENVAFSADLIEEQVNSDVLQVNDEKILVVRVAEYKPQRTLSLEEVSATITTQLTAEKTQQAAVDWAEGLKKSLLNGESVDETLAAKSLEWTTTESIERFGAGLPQEMTKAVFSLAPVDGQNVDVVTLNNGNVGLVKLTGVNAVDEVDPDEVESTLAGLANNNSRQSYESFVAALLNEATIERL